MEMKDISSNPIKANTKLKDNEVKNEQKKFSSGNMIKHVKKNFDHKKDKEVKLSPQKEEKKEIHKEPEIDKISLDSNQNEKKEKQQSPSLKTKEKDNKDSVIPKKILSYNKNTLKSSIIAIPSKPRARTPKTPKTKITKEPKLNLFEKDKEKDKEKDHKGKDKGKEHREIHEEKEHKEREKEKSKHKEKFETHKEKFEKTLIKVNNHKDKYSIDIRSKYKSKFIETSISENSVAVKEVQELLLKNKKWVNDTLLKNPEFLNEISELHRPKYLIISCSDLRISVTQVLSVHPGEVFIHRNIGNIASTADFNMQSVLSYAIENLKIHNIIVLGHSDCSAIKTSLSHTYHGLIDYWLKPVKDIIEKHHVLVDNINKNDPENLIRKLSELNVKEQVLSLCKNPIIQKTWSNKETLNIHGLLFDMNSGYVQDLKIMKKEWKLTEDIHKIDFEKHKIGKENIDMNVK